MRFVSKTKILIFSLLLSAANMSLAASIAPEQAAEIYRLNCAVCHGDKGDGQTRARFGLRPQPRNFTSAMAAAELSRERMIRSVTEGRPNTAMVSWQNRFSTAEIEGVVDYIRNNFMNLTPSKEELAMIDPRMERGKQIFEEHCRVCHGDRGNGSSWTSSVLSPSPRNFTSPQSRRVLTRERMLASVTYGRKETAMMSFANRLSAEDIENVVDYIREIFMKGEVVADAGIGDVTGSNLPLHDGNNHVQAPSSIGAHGMRPGGSPQAQAAVEVDMNAGFPGEMKGDFGRGRDFYLRNCATCHGVRGDGNGLRAHFINPKPRSFIHPESRQTLNRPTLFKAIVIGKAGTVMPAWGKVLGPQEVADVAEFVFQDFIHPNPDEIMPQAEAGLDKPSADKKKAN